MYVADKSLFVNGEAKNNGDWTLRSEKALILPDLLSQSELDIVVPRPTIFAIFRSAFQSFPLAEKLSSLKDLAVPSA